MRLRIVAILLAAVMIAIGIGAWLGGWGDKSAGVDLSSLVEEVVSPSVNTQSPSAPPANAAPAPPVASAPVPPAVQPPQSPTPAVTIPFSIAKPGGSPVSAASGSPGASLTKPEGDSAVKAATEIDRVSLMFRDFRTLMGANPVGTNAEIMKSVNGGNPKQARLGPPEGQQLNGNGELVDTWGTPYFFHQMSATNMEIHSAGPDKTFGTPDDIIGR